MNHDKKDKKKANALARKTHHQKQINNKKRVDAYITPATKTGLLQIKAHFNDVKNEGQAIDKAVALAIEQLNNAE